MVQPPHGRFSPGAGMRVETWEQAARLMEAYAKAERELCQAEMSREAELECTRRRYAGKVERYSARCEVLQEALQRFALAKKTDFRPDPAGPGRSRMVHGVTIGFRLSPPSVRIENVREAARWLYGKLGAPFVRVAVSPDREALKKAFENGDARLRRRLVARGISLARDDRFFIEVRQEGSRKEAQR